MLSHLCRLAGAFALAVIPVMTPLPAPTANAEPRTVTVSVGELPPLAMNVDGTLTGFSIELWNEVARRSDWNTEFVVQSGVANRLQSVVDRRADVAITAISITSTRERLVEFSLPTLHSGLQIMVRYDEVATAQEPTAARFLKMLFSRAMLTWLLVAVVISILPAHVIWLIERRSPTSAVSRSYIPGIVQSFAWALGKLARHVEGQPGHWMSRAVAILWSFVGIIFVAMYTATLTATLTVEHLYHRIDGPADLAGQRVATVTGTTSVDHLHKLGAIAVELASVDDCVAALEKSSVDAVVFDSPPLRYYAAHDGAGRVAVVGPPFEHEDYGAAFAIGSDLTRQFNQGLLEVRESGFYDELLHRWFGDSI